MHVKSGIVANRQGKLDAVAIPLASIPVSAVWSSLAHIALQTRGEFQIALCVSPRTGKLYGSHFVVLFLQGELNSSIAEKVFLVFWIVGIPVWYISVLFTTFGPCPNCESCFAAGLVFSIFVSNILFRNS